MCGQVLFGSAPIYDIDIKRISGKWKCTRFVLFPWRSRSHGNFRRVCKNIRIFNGREIPIENSITRVTVRHHEASLLDDILSTVAFRLEYVLFYQLYAKITTFFDREMFGSALLLYVYVETFRGNWRENEVKMSKSSYWRHARETSYTPHVRRHFLAPVGFAEIPVGYARNILAYCLIEENVS